VNKYRDGIFDELSSNQPGNLIEKDKNNFFKISKKKKNVKQGQKANSSEKSEKKPKILKTKPRRKVKVKEPMNFSLQESKTILKYRGKNEQIMKSRKRASSTSVRMIDNIGIRKPHLRAHLPPRSLTPSINLKSGPKKGFRISKKGTPFKPNSSKKEGSRRRNFSVPTKKVYPNETRRKINKIKKLAKYYGKKAEGSQKEVGESKEASLAYPKFTDREVIKKAFMRDLMMSKEQAKAHRIKMKLKKITLRRPKKLRTNGIVLFCEQFEQE
jgi:hypothetical protein